MEIAIEQSKSNEEEEKREKGIEGSSSSSTSSCNSTITTEETTTTTAESTSTTTSGNMPDGYIDDDDDEDVCRICRNPGETDNPLRYPCACSGSIKFVHQDCLLQWLNHSNARQCEVCKHPFSFSPVYAENAPLDFLSRSHVMQFFLRLAFVLFVWLLIIPFITFWIWRLAFVRSLGEAQRLFISHLSTTVVLTDCLHGFLLSASIVFIFLGATSLRDYFKHLRELGGQDVEREDEGERNGLRAARRPPVPPNRIPVVDGIDEDAAGGQGIAGAGQIIRRNAENVAARLELQAARLEAHVEQMFDGLDDADGAEDQYDISRCCNFVPFSLGRVILHYISWISSEATGPTVMPLTESALSLANITLKNALNAMTNMTSDIEKRSLFNHVVEVVTETLNTNTTELGEVSNNIGKPLSANLLKGHLVGSQAFPMLLRWPLVTCLFSIWFFLPWPLTLGRFYGMASMIEAVPSLIRQFLAAMRHLLTMVKVAFLLVIELGVFPLMCGWWLDICTVKMLGRLSLNGWSSSQSLPLASSLVHWVVGIVYMLQISIFVSLLEGYYELEFCTSLQDPADPNYNPFRDLIDDPVQNLIVMLVFLPVKLAMRLVPSMFPLDILVSDPFTEIPADMLLVQICIPFAIEHFKLRATVKTLLRHWFKAVGWALGLTDFLLPKSEDNGGQEAGNVERNDRLRDVNRGGVGQQDRALVALVAAEDRNRAPHALRNSDVAEEYDSDEQADPVYGFVLGVVLLLVLAWMSLLLFNSALIVVPISLGRTLFNAIPHLPITHGIKCNDLYAFIIGSYVIWTLLAVARYCIEHVKTGRAKILVAQILKWGSIGLKSSALLSIWIFIIPVMIGLLFELVVIVPMRVPVDESPVFLLYQDWALGLIFLKIWTRLVMLDHMTPLVDESWRLKFERVRDDVIPIVMKLLTALCVPYVFARGLFPVLGYSLIVNSAVYRLAWVGSLSFSVIFFCAKRFHLWFTNLHNSIRDDRYLIGRRLHNFGEDKILKRNEAETVSETESQRDSGLLQQGQEADVGLRLRHLTKCWPHDKKGVKNQGQLERSNVAFRE
ncbi:hypothetical protein MKW92_008206 [Papaver armeniacum]|nr:hypothetical protein MKW92_008206 [Papaver armeniacum]